MQTHADKEEIWVLDKNKDLKLPRGIHAHLGPHYLERLTEFDVIFRSPGIPYFLPQIQAAQKRGVIISSATKLFFEQLRGLMRTLRGQSQKTFSPVIIGITGTKGKGTTCTLLYKMLKAAHATGSTSSPQASSPRPELGTKAGQAGKDVYLAGNIGAPALNLLSKTHNLTPKTYVILELSSFQLQDLETSPHIAAVLDIFPDHQDAHKNLAEYYGAKANIARHQTKRDSIFFFSHNALSRALARKSPGKKIGVDEKRFRLFSPSAVRLAGAHNFKNAVMAATIARSLGVPRATIVRIVKSFKGNEHRLELVRVIRMNSGRSGRVIKFYNDSASTNPHTTAAAIRAFSSKTYNLKPKTSATILIAGGRSKVHDYQPIRKALNAETKLVILIGENRKEIARAIRSSGVPFVFAKTLRDAVMRAVREARVIGHRLSVIGPHTAACVLFSPGSASFDMFKDYAARGKQFKKIVKQLR